jgi:ATP-dependent Clp protease protease subunit
MGLLGIMKTSKIPVHTIVTGCAMSCGFIIAISGHKRFGYEDSTFLYHQVSGGGRGKVKDIEENLDEMKRLQEKIEHHVLKNTRITEKQLSKVYTRKIDWTIDAKKAMKLGIIDEII